MEKKHEILLGLTTTPKSDWRGKVEEMKKFGIKRIALFPTRLNILQRKELYTLLEDIEGLEIPHVHMRHQDFEPWEMEMLESKYNTKCFNVHPESQLNIGLERYVDKIYVENWVFRGYDVLYLQRFAGICLDTEHLHRAKTQAPAVYKQIIDLLDKFPIGCCHLSPERKSKNIIKRIFLNAWRHYYLSLDEFNYVTQYKQFLPLYISLELENSFKEQLEAREYLEKLLDI